MYLRIINNNVRLTFGLQNLLFDKIYLVTVLTTISKVRLLCNANSLGCVHGNRFISVSHIFHWQYNPSLCLFTDRICAITLMCFVMMLILISLRSSLKRYNIQTVVVTLFNVNTCDPNVVE